MRFTIPVMLPGMNEIVAAAKGHWGQYSKMKDTYTKVVAFSAAHLPEIEQADIIITWYCKDKRRDKDNISSGAKFVLDGLQMAGVIKNDGWKQVRDITHRFEVDKHNPRVEVDIREVNHESAKETG